YKAVCSRCGQVIRDRREISDNGEILCRPCSDNCYFSNAREVSWPGLDRAPENTPADALKIGNTPPVKKRKEILRIL
ncbi:MAG: hypothetical protein ABII06_03085, partial [Pseudomonadota bacterium]